MSFKKSRILVLLLLLAFVGGISFWEGLVVRSWVRPLQVVIYPINGDGSEATDTYIDALSVEQFREIGTFFDRQAARYRLKKLPPVRIELGKPIAQLPPPPPEGARSPLAAILWSLETRYFAFHNTPFWRNLGRIRLFVVYHQGEDGKPLQHSLGLRKGLIGVVHVFAQDKQGAQNNIVIAHELLHALGASDKYDAQGNPTYPDGFADPDDGPHYPQQDAELMAGRRAVSPDHAEIPDSLASCVIGAKTAYEINW
jgi:hypothetical protein